MSRARAAMRESDTGDESSVRRRAWRIAAGTRVGNRGADLRPQPPRRLREKIGRRSRGAQVQLMRGRRRSAGRAWTREARAASLRAPPRSARQSGAEGDAADRCALDPFVRHRPRRPARRSRRGRRRPARRSGRGSTTTAPRLPDADIPAALKAGMSTRGGPLPRRSMISRHLIFSDLSAFEIPGLPFLSVCWIRSSVLRSPDSFKNASLEVEQYCSPTIV